MSTYKLRSSEYLGKENEDHAQSDLCGIVIASSGDVGKGVDDVRLVRWKVIQLLLDQTTGQPDEADTQRDSHERCPLVHPQPSTEEDDGQDAHPEDEDALGHGINANGREDQADVHERRATD